jgi:hypothetical protein
MQRMTARDFPVTFAVQGLFDIAHDHHLLERAAAKNCS